MENEEYAPRPRLNNTGSSCRTRINVDASWLSILAFYPSLDVCSFCSSFLPVLPNTTFPAFAKQLGNAALGHPDLFGRLSSFESSRLESFLFSSFHSLGQWLFVFESFERQNSVCQRGRKNFCSVSCLPFSFSQSHCRPPSVSRDIFPISIASPSSNTTTALETNCLVAVILVNL